MLNLQSETSAEWTRIAVENVDALLIDHVHCEKKAAATALSLINRYPERTLLVEKMSRHAIEEMEHFRTAFDLAKKRELPLTRDRGDPYVRALMILRRAAEPHRLLDSLVIAAIIEARSCERFTLLTRSLPPSEVRTMYLDLIPSEAAHHVLFLSLAREYYPGEEVRRRLDEVSREESAILRTLVPPSPAIHG